MNRLSYGDFDNFKVLYKLKIELVNMTPLSIGSGKSPFGAVDNPIVRRGDRPYIPGSSLKGVLRSEAERIARATMKQEKVCDIMNPNEELDRKKKECDSYRPCIICRIFGGPTIASHITIYDAYPMDDSYRINVRHRVAINRLTNGQHPGKLFDVEQVEPGTKWLCEMHVENIDIISDGNESNEVKLLRNLFSTIGRYGMTVGGKKSTGLGLLKVNLLEAMKLSIEDGEFREENVTEFIIKLFGVM
ncbi:MAG: CRISPR-associated RAMP protein Csx7 [Nitrososphaerota archaeon]